MAVYLRRKDSEELIKFLNSKGFYIWEIDVLTLEKVSTILPYTNPSKVNLESNRSTFIECASAGFLKPDERNAVLKELDRSPSVLRYILEENRRNLGYQD